MKTAASPGSDPIGLQEELDRVIPIIARLSKELSIPISIDTYKSDVAEKAIMAYGAIEMSFLEKGLIWISLFISVAPMLGFTGTVWGMINAFDSIKKANDISPNIVAGGISQALLTTAFGLVVAMIIQVFYNFFTSRIDKLIIDMEESSVELMDALVEMQNK